MRAVFKREFRICFQTVTGWLFLAVTLAFYFLYFYVYNLSYGNPYITYPLNSMTFLFLITVPVLTMRILAEERHAKTDQLILTAPVSVGKIVLAKYLALAAVFTAAMAVTGLSVLFAGSFGTVPYKENFVALSGFWLYGLTCIAIGTFVSSLTESQVIAAVLSFVFLFAGYMMGAVTGLISTSGNLLTKILNCYNLTDGLDRLSGGELDLTAVIYYISISGLFLFLTVQSIQKRRWSVSARRIGTGVFHAGFAAAAIIAVVLLNIVADTLPSSWTKIDCTYAGLYAISEDTKHLLSGLKEPVDLYVLAGESSADQQLDNTLRTYEELSPKVKVTYMDPAVSPNFYQKYTQDNIPVNSIIAVCGERSKVISYSDIYESVMDYQTYTSQTTGYDAEGQLTSAIQYLTSKDLQTVYELTGHGETALSGSFKEAIEKMNLNLQTINLLETEEMPQDCEAVIINGPASDLSRDDVDKILRYLEDGGKALISTQYTTEKMDHLEELLAAYQLRLQEGIIIETDGSRYYRNPMYLLPEIASDAMTASVSDGYVCVPYAQGLSYPKQKTDDTEEETHVFAPLFVTSDQAFLKKDVENMQSLDKEKEDEDGPFTLGLSVTDTDTQAQLVVLTSSLMLGEEADSWVYGSNSGFFTSVVGSFVGDDGTSSLIVIPVKQYTLEALTIPRGTAVLAGIITVIVIPLSLLVLGLVIWIRRRRA